MILSESADRYRGMETMSRTHTIDAGHRGMPGAAAARIARLGLTTVALVGASAWPAGMARAAATSIDVTTLVDDGAAASAGNCPGAACSVRDAVAYANANPGTTINIPAGVFQLAGTALTITAPATISGAGAGGSGTVLEQRAGSGDRVLAVETSTGQVMISDVEVTGGNTTGAGLAQGGGVLVATGGSATTTLSGDLIDHNSAIGAAGAGPGANGGDAAGGGVFASGWSGNLTVTGTVITNNTAGGGAGENGTSGAGGQGGSANGGGVAYYGAGALTITGGSTVSDNTAAGAKGARRRPVRASGRATAPRAEAWTSGTSSRR